MISAWKAEALPLGHTRVCKQFKLYSPNGIAAKSPPRGQTCCPEKAERAVTPPSLSLSRFCTVMILEFRLRPGQVTDIWVCQPASGCESCLWTDSPFTFLFQKHAIATYTTA